MKTKKIFDIVEIAAGENEISQVLDLKSFVMIGYFSLQIRLTGNGTGKFEYQLSLDDQTYVTQSANVISSNFTKTSGPGGDGKDIISFEPEPASTLRIKVTEIGTTDSITVTATILMI